MGSAKPGLVSRTIARRPAPAGAARGRTRYPQTARIVVALAVAAVLLAGCAPVFPPIAERGGDAALKARIATGYRPGSSAAPLRARLVAEGFTIVDDPRTGFASAFWRPDNLPCFSRVRIDWREDRRGRVTIIQAARQSCT